MIWVLLSIRLLGALVRCRRIVRTRFQLLESDCCFVGIVHHLTTLLGLCIIHASQIVPQVREPSCIRLWTLRSKRALVRNKRIVNAINTLLFPIQSVKSYWFSRTKLTDFWKHLSSLPMRVLYLLLDNCIVLKHVEVLPISLISVIWLIGLIITLLRVFIWLLINLAPLALVVAHLVWLVDITFCTLLKPWLVIEVAFPACIGIFDCRLLIACAFIVIRAKLLSSDQSAVWLLITSYQTFHLFVLHQ